MKEEDPSILGEKRKRRKVTKKINPKKENAFRGTSVKGIEQIRQFLLEIN